MIIAIDVDDVLADFFDQLIRFHNKNYDTSFIKEDFVTYDVWDIWGGTRQEAIDKMHEFFRSEYFEEIKPIEGSLRAIKELKKKHKLVVVTSRFDMVTEKTILWLKKHYHDALTDVHFSHYEKDTSKATACKRLGAEILIDDATKNVMECAGIGMHILLFDCPWNRDIVSGKNITRVHNWDEILKEISRLES